MKTIRHQFNPTLDKQQEDEAVRNLDEAVHELMLLQASAVNNSGLSAQVAFLRDRGASEEEIAHSAGVPVEQLFGPGTERRLRVEESAVIARTRHVWVPDSITDPDELDNFVTDHYIEADVVKTRLQNSEIAQVSERDED